MNLPKLNRGGRTRDGRSMFVFGVSYAIASISCAFPLFAGTVVGAFRREDALTSVAVFVAYALGMTLVLRVPSPSASGWPARACCRGSDDALPFVTRASGVLLVVAGAYLVALRLVRASRASRRRRRRLTRRRPRHRLVGRPSATG